MAASGVRPGDLTGQAAERYASARRAAGYAHYRSVHGLEPLLGYLRGLGEAPAAQELLERLQRYLVSERAIGAANAESYACFARPFIAARLAPGGPGLEGLTAADVTAFVVASCPGMPKGSAKMTVTALRSLLVWLHVDGVLGQSLAWAVPARRRLHGMADELLGVEHAPGTACPDAGFCQVPYYVRPVGRQGRGYGCPSAEVERGDVMLRDHEALGLAVLAGRAHHHLRRQAVQGDRGGSRKRGVGDLEYQGLPD